MQPRTGSATCLLPAALPPHPFLTRWAGMQWDLDPLGESARPSEGPALVYSIYELKVLGKDHCSPNLERRRVGGKRRAWFESDPSLLLSALSQGSAWPAPASPTRPQAPQRYRAVGKCKDVQLEWLAHPSGLRLSEWWTAVK